MASAGLYDASVAFLMGDAGDVRAAINAEFPGVMVAGSVLVAREGLAPGTRREKAPGVAVEIVPQGSWPSRSVGLGYEELDVVLHLKCASYGKDLIQGTNQLLTPAHMAQALVRRYRGASALAVTVSGATFVRATASLLAMDVTSNSTLITTSVVRLILTFMEAQAANT